MELLLGCCFDFRRHPIVWHRMAQFIQAEEQKVQMTIGVNHSITISALGLSVLPGSKFSVRAHIKKNTKLKNRRALVNDSYPWTAQTINTTEKSYDQIVQVELDQKFTVEADTSAILTVEFSGLPGEVGFVKVGRK